MTTDAELLERLERGERVVDIASASKTYQRLVSGLMLQFADSELAGSAAYCESVKFAPGLSERIDVATIARDKMVTARRTYELISEFGINLEKYFSSHNWEARVSRYTDLGYSRASADRRLNALMYPLEGFADLAVFTYLMAAMTVVQLEDFLDSSYEPWAKLCQAFLLQETNHKELGRQFILGLLTRQAASRLSLQASLDYWHLRVAQSFGPDDSEGNEQYRSFKLKARRNREARLHWQEEIASTLSELGLEVPDSRQSVGR